MNKVFIITGPIAAGKSSCAEMLIKKYELKYYEFISTDFYFKNYFFDNNKDINLCYKQAKRFCEHKLEQAMRENRNFIWETVVAKKDKMDVILKLKTLGYEITAVFIGVDDVEVCINRALIREIVDGYSIPENKIKDRFEASFKFLKELQLVSDKLIIIDNTIRPIEILYQTRLEKKIVMEENKLKNKILERLKYV